MKQYKIAKGWAIFIYVFAPLLILLFAWVAVLPFKDGNFSPNLNWIAIPISLGMMAIGILAMMETYKSRLILEDDGLTSVGLFSTRKLKANEIKGFSRNEQYTIIEPSVEGKKRIKVSQYTSGYGEIANWLADRYPNLVKQRGIEEEAAILNDERRGWTREARAETLRRAKKTATVVNIAGTLAAAWAFLYPTPYSIALAAALIVPLIAIMAAKFSDGLIRFNEEKGSAHPTIFYALIFPSLSLMLRALFDFEIIDYSRLWQLVAGSSVLLLVVMFVKQQELRFTRAVDYFTVLCFAAIFVSYGYGGVVHVNCHYDQSDPKQYTVDVLDKRISSGKTTSYYLKLSAWGPRTEEDEVGIDKDLFERVEAGDQVSVYLMKGHLDVSWIVVTEE